MKRIRRGTLSEKVFISVLSVVLISFLFLASVLTFWGYQQMSKEYNQVRQAYISNVNVNFSRYLDGMRTFVENYYTSRDGIIARNRESYELDSQIGFLEDTIKHMEPFYQSVFILNSEGKVTFDARKGISYPLALEQRVEELAREQRSGISSFLWTIKNRYSDLQDIYMLSMFIQEATIGEKYYSGSVVLNVDTMVLSEVLFENFKQDNFETYIIDHNGLVVAHSDLNLVGQDMSEQLHIQEILTEKSGNSRMKVKEKWVDLVYQDTDYPGFCVVVQSNYSGGFFDSIGLMPVGLLMFDFIVSIILIYILCNRLFRTFNDVTTHMRDAMEHEYDVKRVYDDVQFLEQYHQLTSNYVNKLRLQDDKNFIIKSLLQNTWNQGMQKFLVDKKMIVSGLKYAAVILQIDPGESVAEENIDICKRKRAVVEEVINIYMNYNVKCTCLELGLQRLLLILSENGIFSITIIQECMENICEVLRTNRQIKIQFEVSDIVESEEAYCDTLYMQAKKRLTVKTCEETTEAEKDNQQRKRMEAHNNQEMLVRVVDYLNSNYNDCNISVSKLADQFHIQSGYLGKLFQEFTGQSILSYLLDIRMEKAKDLLMTCPQMSVTQVAQAVGFGGSAYFTTSFKKYYGVSPSKIWDFNVDKES